MLCIYNYERGSTRKKFRLKEKEYVIVMSQEDSVQI